MSVDDWTVKLAIIASNVAVINVMKIYWPILYLSVTSHNLKQI